MLRRPTKLSSMSSPPPWRTQLLRCILKSGDNGGTEVAAAAAATTTRIPVNGWYGLFFGSSLSSSSSQNGEHLNYTLLVDVPDNNHKANEQQQHHCNVQSLKLPLVHEASALEHHPSARGRLAAQSCIPLGNVNIGKLVYFTEGCCLSVVKEKSDDRNSSVPDDLNNEKVDHGNDTAPCWGAVLQRSVNSTPELGNTLKVGTMSSLPKSLVCWHCMRSFPTLRGISSHVEEMHEKRPKAATLKRSRSADFDTASTLDTNDCHDNETNSESLYDEPLKVVFQDAYMAIVVKPQNMPVMGCKPSLMRSDLLMALVCTSDEKAAIIAQATTTAAAVATNTITTESSLAEPDSALGKPRPVHRLDSATGGLLVVAKTHAAESKLRISFQERACHKRYRAIVVGRLVVEPTTSVPHVEHGTSTTSNKNGAINGACDGGIIEAPISGKPSKTLYQIVKHVPSIRYKYLTVVDLWPVTGRKHQLRKHMKLIGHSILGDVRHCGQSKATREAENAAAASSTSLTVNDDSGQGEPELPVVDVTSRLCLWAMEITLPHPVTGKDLTVRMDDPDWIDIVTGQEERLFMSTTSTK